MIIDSVARLANYADWLPDLENGLLCLKEHRDKAEPARYDFEGGFMLLQSGMTKPVGDGLFEAHRKYLDIQILLDGEEVLSWADVDELQPAESYDSDKDKAMFSGDGSTISIQPGTCCIFWPGDAHKACRCIGACGSYRKAVIKLLLHHGPGSCSVDDFPEKRTI